PFVVLLSAYFWALQKQLSRDQLLLGTTVSLRDDPQLQAVLGPAINYLVLRADLHGIDGPRSVLPVVHRLVGGALEHRSYPFAQLLAELVDERVRAALPQLGCNANFNFYDVESFARASESAHQRMGGQASLGPVRATEQPIPAGAVIRPYDLNCGI